MPGHRHDYSRNPCKMQNWCSTYFLEMLNIFYGEEEKQPANVYGSSSRRGPRMCFQAWQATDPLIGQARGRARESSTGQTEMVTESILKIQ